MTIPYLNEVTLDQPAISIDLETGSLRADAPIVSIGAVRFYPDGSPLKYKDAAHYAYSSFHMFVSLQGQSHFDNDTLAWWLQTGDVDYLRRATMEGERLPEVLEALSRWIQDPVIQHGDEHRRLRPAQGSPDIWVRGNKDGTWLEEAFNRCMMPKPFQFSRVYEERTLSKFAMERGVELPERFSPEHHARWDAEYQAQRVQAVYKAFPIDKE